MGTNISKLNVNGTSIGNVSANGEDLKLVRLEVNGADGVTLFAKALSITADTSKVSALSCKRSESTYAGASTGNIELTSDIYYGDKISFNATEKEGYGSYSYKINDNGYSLNTTYTVEDNVNFVIECKTKLLNPILSSTYDKGIVVTNPSANPTVNVYCSGKSGLITTLSAGDSYTITGLTAGSTYTITFKDTTGAYADSYNNCTVIKDLDAPVIQSADYNYIEVWNKNGISAEVYYGLSSTNMVTGGTASANQTDFILNHLNDSSTYYLQFRNNTYSLTSDIITAKTVVAAPIVVSCTTSDIVILNDSCHTATINCYLDGVLKKSVSVAANAQYTFSDLSYGEDYEFNASVSNYETSSSVYGSTLLLSPSVRVYTNKFVVTNDNNMTVSLYYKKDTDSTYTRVTDSLAYNADISIVNLNNGMKYQLKFTTSDHESDVAEEITYLNEPVVSNIKSTSFDLTNSNDCAVDYTVYLSSPSSASASGNILSNNTVNISGMTAGETYEIEFENTYTTEYGTVTLAGDLVKIPSFDFGESTTSEYTWIRLYNESTIAAHLLYSLNGTDWNDLGEVATKAYSSQVQANWNTTYYIKATAAGYDDSAIDNFTTEKRKLPSPTITKKTTSSIIIHNNCSYSSVECVIENDSTSAKQYIIVSASSDSSEISLSRGYTYYIWARLDGYEDSDLQTIYITSADLKVPVLAERTTSSIKVQNNNEVAVTVSADKTGTWDTTTASANGGYATISGLSAGEDITIEFTADGYTESYLSTKTFIGNLVVPTLSSSTVESITATNDSTNPAVDVLYNTVNNLNTATLAKSGLAAGDSYPIDGLDAGKLYYIFFTCTDYKYSVNSCTVLSSLSKPVLTKFTTDLGLLQIDNTNSNTAVSYVLTEKDSSTIISKGSLAKSTSSPHSTTVSNLTTGTTYTVTFSATGYADSSNNITMYAGILSAPTISYRTNTLISVKNPNNMTVYFTTTAGSTTQSWISKNGTTDITGLSAEQTITVTLTCDNYVSASADLTTLSSQLLSPIFDDSQRTETSIVFSNPNEISVDYKCEYGAYTKSASIFAGDSVTITGITASTAGTEVTTTFSKSGYISASAVGYTMPQLLAPQFVGYDHAGIIVKNTNDITVTLTCSYSGSSESVTTTLGSGDSYTYYGSGAYGGTICTFVFTADGYASSTLTHANAQEYVEVSCSNSSVVNITNKYEEAVKVYYNTTKEVDITSEKYIGLISTEGGTLTWTPADNKTYYVYGIPTSTSRTYYSEFATAYRNAALTPPTITYGESNTNDSTYFTITNNASVQVSVAIGVKDQLNPPEYYTIDPEETSPAFTAAWYTAYEGETATGLYKIVLKSTSTEYHYSSYIDNTLQTNMKQLKAPVCAQIAGDYNSISIRNTNKLDTTTGLTVNCHVESTDGTYSTDFNMVGSYQLDGLDNSVKYNVSFSTDKTIYYLEDSDITTISPTAYPQLSAPVISEITSGSFKFSNSNSINVQYVVRDTVGTIIKSGTAYTGVTVLVSGLSSRSTYRVTFSATERTSNYATATTDSTTPTEDFYPIELSSVVSTAGHTIMSLSNPNTVDVILWFFADSTEPAYKVSMSALSCVSIDIDAEMGAVGADSTIYELWDSAEECNILSGTFDIDTFISNDSFKFIASDIKLESTAEKIYFWFAPVDQQTTANTYWAEFISDNGTILTTDRIPICAGVCTTTGDYFTFFDPDDMQAYGIDYGLTSSRITINFYEDQTCVDKLQTLCIYCPDIQITSEGIAINSLKDLLYSATDNSLTMVNNNLCSATYKLRNKDESTDLDSGHLYGGDRVHSSYTEFDTTGSIMYTYQLVGSFILNESHTVNQDFTIQDGTIEPNGDPYYDED